MNSTGKLLLLTLNEQEEKVINKIIIKAYRDLLVIIQTGEVTAAEKESRESIVLANLLKMLTTL